jgi:hypothetical protein
MPLPLCSVLAVITGCVVAFVVVALVESWGHWVYPLPRDLDFTQPERVAEFIQTLPAGAFGFVLAAWFLGTLVGGVTAALMTRRRPFVTTGIVAGVVLLATAANLLLIPHPLWFAVTGISGIFVAWLLAGALTYCWSGRATTFQNPAV